MRSTKNRGDFFACNVYVDGQNMRIHLRDAGLNDEFDPTKIARLVSGEWLAGKQLLAVRTFYYDTIPEQLPDSAQGKHRDYLERVELPPDTQVVMGRTVGAGRQKGVDVQLAVDALEAAWSGRVEAIAIVSGDGDFVPVVEAIRRAGPHVFVLAFKDDLSRELRDASDRAFYFRRSLGIGLWPDDGTDVEGG